MTDAAADALRRHDIALVRAENPSPLTLSGSNTWIVGREPAWVVDPGPSLPAHVTAVAAECERRGGLAGVVVTHDHHDHVDGTEELRAQTGDPSVAAARSGTVTLADGDRIGPFEAFATPGHTTDHLAFVAGGACFTGDAVLGEGSVFIAPGPGAMAGYLAALRRLRGRRLEILCPGHGNVVTDPAAKLDEYLAHRLERERRLVDALDRGLRRTDELLDDAWSDAPANLRGAAAVTLAAHLDKLAEEGRLPAGVERPAV